MEDLIKREDAIKYCKSKAEHYRKRLARIEAQGDAICYDPTEQINFFKDEIAIYESFVKELEGIPSAEPTVDKDYLIELIQGAVYDGEDCARLMKMVEPKHGKWIVDRYCSECEWDKKEAGYTSGWTENYCPNCGARMKGESDDKERSGRNSKQL